MDKITDITDFSFEKNGYHIDVTYNDIFGISAKVRICGDDIAIYPDIEYNPNDGSFRAKFNNALSLKPSEKDLWHKGIDCASEFIIDAENFIKSIKDNMLNK